MKLLGERNWYLQRRLERLPRFEFGEPSVAPEAAPRRSLRPRSGSGSRPRIAMAGILIRRYSPVVSR
jgi:hypothetical protein